MATIATEGKGLRRILFVADKGKRKGVRIGKVPKHRAETFKTMVEHLVVCRRLGVSPDGDTARWLNELDDVIYERIAATGLIASRSARNSTLAELFNHFFEHFEGKPATRRNYKITEKSMLSFFDGASNLRGVPPIKAQQWRKKLEADGLAPTTISKMVREARRVFARGIEWGWIDQNIFTKVKAGKISNKSRQEFITRETIDTLMKACPNAKWKLIVALSRYGGLRCPSEHIGLRWSDIDWTSKRFRVTSPKTEHHEGKGERWVPLFPELVPYLKAVQETSLPDEDRVLGYTRTNVNFRPDMTKWIKNAGLRVWPRVFHNLRASRQTELEKEHSLHIVCGWLGNSPDVARESYLQTTSEDFKKAVQNPVQQAAESLRTVTKSPSPASQDHTDFPSDSMMC